jgi:hypothetical protein
LSTPIPRRASLALVLLLGGAVAASDAHAQAPPPGGSAPLGFDHWSYELLEALDVAGLASGWMNGVRPTGREVVRGELRRVHDNGFGTGAAGRTIAAWTDRFDRDFPARPPRPAAVPGATLPDAALPDSPRWQLGVDGGVQRGSGSLDRTTGFFSSVSGSVSPSARTALWGRFDRHAYRQFDGVQAAGVSFPLGAFTVMAGRQRLKAAGPAWTSAQLDGQIPLDALYVVSDRPVSLPGTKWLIGPAAWHFTIAPLEGVGQTGGAWMGVGGMIAEPHPRLRLGATRSAQFGPGLLAEGTDASITPGRVLRMFFITQNDPTWWDDQKLELSARFRWGLFGQPLASYLVLAQEDSPLWKDPGLLVGMSAPVIRPSGLFNVRYEYTAYGRRARWCPGCEYARGEHGDRYQAPWYDHGNFHLYEREGIPRGDPLGGYGSNHKASLAFFSMDGRTRMRAWTFFERRDEGNLLYDRWPGTRRGGGIEFAHEVTSGAELVLMAMRAGGPEVPAEWGLRLGMSALWGAGR